MYRNYKRSRRPRLSPADKMQQAREALDRARNSPSWANFPEVIQQFAARGIPAEQIIPKVNVFVYSAWPALGRHVRKGEKSVKITTMYPIEETQPDGTKKITGKRFGTACVFHISQTDPIDGLPQVDITQPDEEHHAPCTDPECEFCN